MKWIAERVIFLVIGMLFSFNGMHPNTWESWAWLVALVIAIIARDWALKPNV